MLDMDYERLLNRASLLVTPTLYKEGVLYPQIPTYNSNGDFSVTRATTATRVNAAGLVELVPYNLFTYSEQFNNAAWTKVNATITANSTTAPNGTLTADTMNLVGTLSNITQTLALRAGTYTVSIWVKTINVTTAGNLRFSIVIDGVTTSFSFAPTSTWTRFTQTFTASVSVGLVQIVRGFGFVGDVAIWGAQLVEGAEAKDYQATETRLNIPRLDYSLGSCPNLLLEPQRTNIVTYSEQFDNAAWTKVNATITANAAISPSGLSNADKLYPSTSGTVRRCFESITVTNATVYTSSAYIKADGKNWVLFTGVSNAANTFVYFDLANGVVGTVGAAATASITSVGNGWYRCIVTSTSTSTAGYSYFAVVDGDNSTNVTANGTDGILVWGAQLEAGAYPTSYIPTTSASVTRNQDVISRGNIFTNGLITASGGTWFVELRNNIVRTRDAFGFIGIWKTSPTANSLGLYSQINGRLAVAKYISSSITALFSTSTDTIKVAIKWNGATADVFVNGVKVVNATAFALADMDSTGAGVTPLIAYINSMALFPTPLTDGEMSMLTSGVYTPALAYAQLGLVSESPACLDSSVNALL
jgi:hypothetical protein